MIEAVCIASGPSLTADDCEVVRGWSDSSPARFVVVTNNTFILCPWADYLFAMDNEWWRHYGEEVHDKFNGAKYSRHGNYGSIATPVHHGDNSGVGAVLLADYLGADRIFLLGYDCQHTGGRVHWHGNHKKPLGNTQSMPHWRGFFEQARASIAADVVNITRQTALDVFRRGTLEDELH